MSSIQAKALCLAANMNYILKIYCDGGARGNPGPAGVGIVIIDSDGQEKKFKRFIGVKTNNQAEYEAVLYALEMVAREYGKAEKIDFFLDSELVVNQLSGNYKIKNEALGRLLIKIRNLIIKNGYKADFRHIPREKNHHADSLVNQAIESRYKK